MADSARALPAYNFTSHPSVSLFSVPCETYISNNTSEGPKYRFMATGALVFDSASTPVKILLLQRSPNDSMPNLWEIPGGGCDEEDPSILHGAARELWEEAGLVAKRVGPQVGGAYMFTTGSGNLVCKIHFAVEAERSADGKLDVKLDPEEHQDYVWATEEEVLAGKAGDVVLDFTTAEQKAIILEAFKARREIVDT